MIWEVLERIIDSCLQVVKLLSMSVRLTQAVFMHIPGCKVGLVSTTQMSLREEKTQSTKDLRGLQRRLQSNKDRTTD